MFVHNQFASVLLIVVMSKKYIIPKIINILSVHKELNMKQSWRTTLQCPIVSYSVLQCPIQETIEHYRTLVSYNVIYWLNKQQHTFIWLKIEHDEHISVVRRSTLTDFLVILKRIHQNYKNYLHVTDSKVVHEQIDATPSPISKGLTIYKEV